MEPLTRQKVYDKLERELKRIETINKLIEEEKDETEEFYNENREPLSIETTKEVKILLSWGGGEDGYKLTFNSENELISGVYYIADWGEYQEVALNDNEMDLIFDHYLGNNVSLLEK